MGFEPQTVGGTHMTSVFVLHFLTDTVAFLTDFIFQEWEQIGVVSKPPSVA